MIFILSFLLVSVWLFGKIRMLLVSPESRDSLVSSPPGDGLINEIPDLGMERDELKAAVAQENTVDLITNAVYLQDQPHAVCGIKLYGTPW